MLSKKNINCINLIFLIIICILSYIFLTNPIIKNCKDIEIPKNASCHNQIICWDNENCDLDADVCPLPCNSISRFVIIFMTNILFSILAGYIAIGILFCICNLICNKINHNSNVYTEI